jgi:hypothetical protein
MGMFALLMVRGMVNVGQFAAARQSLVQLRETGTTFWTEHSK